MFCPRGFVKEEIALYLLTINIIPHHSPPTRPWLSAPSITGTGRCVLSAPRPFLIASPTSPEKPPWAHVGVRGYMDHFAPSHHHATPFAISASDPTVHPNPLTYPTHSPDCQRPPPPTQRARDVKLLFKDNGRWRDAPSSVEGNGILIWPAP